MAKFCIKNTTKVSELKDEFNKAFGAKLRVYVGRSQVNDNTSLAEVGLTNEGSFECRSSLTAGAFIKRMFTEYGLKVKVYTCDEWVAVLDGLTLESAGKVKKNAVKADMESMIAYQRTMDASETKIEMNEGPKDTAIYEDYIININLDNSISVLKGGNICSNTKSALRDISILINFEFDPNWTTRQFGVKLINAINKSDLPIEEKDENFVVDGITYSFSKKGEVYILFGSGLSGDIVIPDEVFFKGKGYPVTGWGWPEEDDDEEEDYDDIENEELFDDDETGFVCNKKITSITLPNSLKYIRSDAISECPNLESITIGTGIKKIDAQAIFSCDKLKTIRIFADADDVECDGLAYVGFGDNEPQFIYGKEVIPNMTNSEHILHLFHELCKRDVYTSVFSTDKIAIEKIFKNTTSNSKENIMTRLTIIDSMYSTQMSKRYYGLDELSDVICHFDRLDELAIQFTKEPHDASIFTCKIKQKGLMSLIKSDQMVSLFNSKYGIKKNGEDSGVAISLISKYLYFLTNYKFPIYDSIAIEMFPRLWNYCGFNDMPQYKTALSSSDDNYGNSAIEHFVTAINQLILKLGIQEEPRKYDILDRILWFTGKICRGNLSLIISQEDYTALAQTYKTENNVNTFEFDIEKVDLSKLSFLKDNELLRELFELAKKLGKA